MATHPHSADIEHGGATANRLGKLLAYHISVAEATRVVMAALNGHATVKKQSSNGHGIMAQALMMEHTRKIGRPKGVKNGQGRHNKQGKNNKQAVSLRRQFSFDLLGKFNPKKPVPREQLGLEPKDNKIVGILVHSGYLKKKGKGFVRTSKPYSVTEPRNEPRHVREAKKAASPSHRRQARQSSAKLLAAFDTTEAHPVSVISDQKGRRAIGALVRRGYLKKKGEGYLRTEKEFVVSD